MHNVLLGIGVVIVAFFLLGVVGMACGDGDVVDYWID